MYSGARKKERMRKERGREREKERQRKGKNKEQEGDRARGWYSAKDIKKERKRDGYLAVWDNL